ncbi:MAG: Thiamine biosynthesis lipoprotein ApbE [Aeromicrobium sp.]|nr:Thiamine biosynthesis lipoprotein ApbE [Aeromicrobium sp.]
MPITLVLRGRHANGDAGAAAWSGVIASLRDADQVFSTYREDSEISRVNRGSLTLADVSPDVDEVLAIGEQARIESGGAFDVWLPGPDGARRLDPSGVVKGWAVERAAGLLEPLADTDFCLSAGGDMVCRSRTADSVGWRIGIEDPRDPTRMIAVLPVTNGAVATSGTAHRGTHLVDARTGRTPVGVASVTVVTASLTWADIDATAAYAHGPEAERWLQTRPDRTGLVVWDDRSTSMVRTRAAGAAA